MDARSSGKCEDETDFRSLSIETCFDGRKEEAQSWARFERDDYECGGVWKSRFRLFIVFTFGLEI